MVQEVFLNPQWLVLRSGWRLLIFAFLVAALIIPAAQFISKRVIKPALNLGPWSAPVRTAVGEVLVYGLVAALVVGALVLMINWAERRSVADIGLVWDANFRVDLLVGCALGAILPVGLLVSMLALGWAKISGSFVSASALSFLPSLLGLTVLFISVGLWEELAFRVYLLPTLAQGWNAGGIGPGLAIVLALLATSVPFGLAHLVNPKATPMAAVMIMLAGVMLGLGFILTGRPALGIGLHIAGNIFQTLLGVAPDQGTLGRTRLVGLKITGPTLWTGGSYGVEAGLLSLIFVVVAATLMVGYIHTRYGLQINTQLADMPMHTLK